MPAEIAVIAVSAVQWQCRIISPLRSGHAS